MSLLPKHFLNSRIVLKVAQKSKLYGQVATSSREMFCMTLRSYVKIFWQMSM